MMNHAYKRVLFGKGQKFTVDFNSLWPRRFRSLFGISELSNEIEQFDVVVVNEVSNLRGEVGKFVAKFRTKFGIKFHESISTVTNRFTQQEKAMLR